MDETLIKQKETSLDQSECIVTQPTANGILPHHDAAQAPPPHLDATEDRDSLSSNGNARLLPGASPRSLHPLHQTGANQRAKSPAHITTDAHIAQAAGGDCCVHCLLACLFCELPSLCSALAQCLLCGGGAACAEAGGTCCCSDALVGCCCLDAGCTEECGVIETCCGSTDCLEICLECCSICFPS
ncbi:myoD family inhibitor [Eucyclogobius newberryi]|uniref:myoD family inhibitor n=1 Tax=Eucyclogobius newberryi TaxID=166745 RepID=UPI003B5A152C